MGGAPAPTVAQRSPVAAGALGKAAEFVTLVLLAVVLPRVLGPADYGRFTVSLTVVMIGSTALALGGTPLMSRWVPTAPAGQRALLARALGLRLARSRLTQVAVLLTTAIVLTAAAPERFPPALTILTVVALAGNVMTTLALQAGLGLSRTGPWNARWPVQNAVLLAAVIVLYPTLGPTGSALGIVAAAAAGLGLGLVAVRGLWQVDGSPPALPDSALRFGRTHGAGWAFLQLGQRGGVLAVAILASSTVETGYMGLAVGVAMAAVSAVLQLFVVSLPSLAVQADASEGQRAGEQVLNRLAEHILWLLVPAAVVAALVLERAIPLAFGAEFAAAADAFVPMLGVVTLAPAGSLLIQAAALRLRAEATLWSALGGVVAFALVSILAIPPSGAIGGAWATFAGSAATVATASRLLPGALSRRVASLTAVGAASAVALALAAA